MSLTIVKGLSQEKAGSKKAKPVSVDTRFPSVSRKIRGIITITDPAIIEEIAESDLLG
jgi:type II secretory pathway component PulC